MKILFPMLSCLMMSFSLMALEVETQAKKVVGESKVDKVENIKNCFYFVFNHEDRNSVSVGINSKDAPGVNIAMEINNEDLPLREGVSLEDSRGHKAIYEDGVLKVERVKSDDLFGGKETRNLALAVSNDLTQVEFASARTTYKKFFSTKIDAEIECHF